MSKKGNFIKICNLDGQDQINNSIFERNISTFKSNNPLSNRPEATKYSFPILSGPSSNSCSKIIDVNFKQQNDDNNDDEINKRTSVSFYDYSNNVDNESILRNQIYALQNCAHATYIPSTNSNMYVNNIPSNGNNNAEVLYPHLIDGNLVENKNNQYDKFKKNQSLYFNNQTSSRAN
tara:strand:- start:738 stop:1268 length:531 start_codon:yes stop_codon:yes gene_type:complete